MATFYSPKTVTDNLIFYYDVGNVKSYAGEPTTNTNGWGQYNYWWGNAIVGRNVTGPTIPPPITGYEIASLISTDGQDTQTILYTASVDQVNGGVYTHSAYVYLVSGTWATVGQHWNPWDYGVQNYIPKGQWTRISYTLTNSSNNYGAVALSYNTNGMIYITAPQYEKKSHSTPFVYGTRSNTQGLLDLTGNYVLDLTYASYDSSGIITFPANNSSNSYITTSTNCGLTGDQTLTAWIKPVYNTGPHKTVICTDINYQYGIKLMNYKNYGRWGLWLGFGSSNWEALVGGDINTNTIQMITGTWKQSTGVVKLYLNGNFYYSFSTGVTSAIALSNGNIRVGAGYELDFGNGQSYEGSIYSAAIYNRTLTDSEVLQIYNSTKGRFGL